MIRGNVHTHTIYCDGENTAEEMIKAAIEKGFGYIGFSGHSYTDFDKSYAMSRENTKKYIEEITFLKNKYKDKITVLCGIEKDAFSDYSAEGFDYVLASCHYVKADGKYFDVDVSANLQKTTIDAYFGGDPYAYAEEYFKTVGEMTGDIVGHFDLITKFDRAEEIFSPKEERYKKAALSAIEKLLDKKFVFEVNTGAMARGLKNAPYPSGWILEKLKKYNARVIITSDCHTKKNLDFAFDETEKMLSGIGFKDFYNIDFIEKAGSDCTHVAL